MFSRAVTREPNNDAEFQRVKESVQSQCPVAQFEKELRLLNPTPAQLFQVLEVTLLSALPRETKNDFMQKIGEQVAFTLHQVRVVPGDEHVTMMLVDAYRDAAKFTGFCQDQLAQILSNTKDAEGISAEEINSYMFAKLQDRVRYILYRKGLPVEDRNAYDDPAPQMLQRSREDFLLGKGVFEPREEGL